MSLTEKIKKVSLRTAFGYLEKNPEENALKLRMPNFGRTISGARPRRRAAPPHPALRAERERRSPTCPNSSAPCRRAKSSWTATRFGSFPRSRPTPPS